MPTSSRPSTEYCLCCRNWKPPFRADIDLSIALDRTTTIRASVEDVEFTLIVSIVLVVMVVFLFLRNVRATIIPSVAVPVSLIGTFGVMYLCGYSLDNLSLMALTIATGFVVDDAIVVVENISRHLESNMPPFEAAMLGAKEIGFTVLSISVSLVAVFIPILLMNGIIGRLFREFAVTLSVAIGVSMIISLTTTPHDVRVLAQERARSSARLDVQRQRIRVRRAFCGSMKRRCQWCSGTSSSRCWSRWARSAFTGYLYVIVPKGLFSRSKTPAA